MGSAIDTWNDAAGAIYMGAGTSWELIWLVVSAAMCVAAIYIGGKHEADAYREAED